MSFHVVRLLSRGRALHPRAGTSVWQEAALLFNAWAYSAGWTLNMDSSACRKLPGYCPLYRRWVAVAIHHSLAKNEAFVLWRENAFLKATFCPAFSRPSMMPLLCHFGLMAIAQSMRMVIRPEVLVAGYRP